MGIAAMPETDDNPAFVLLELLQDAGWAFEDINTESFMDLAEFFDDLPSATPPDPHR